MSSIPSTPAFVFGTEPSTILVDLLTVEGVPLTDENGYQLFVWGGSDELVAPAIDHPVSMLEPGRTVFVTDEGI